MSIIIPVYNGAKYLNNTVKRLLMQRYSDFEIILVENNSRDDSWDLCKKLQGQDSRVRAFSVPTKGTTLARKYGVLQAKGSYILFHDQDDRIMNPDALGKMVRAIKEDMADICQFGYIKTLGVIINKKIPKKAEQHVQIFDREQIMNSQIKGILGFGWDPTIILGTQVWNKIYKAELLKDAVKNINESLYFCEDEYLNIFAFFNEMTQKVSIRQEYYYYWNTGIGFSSSNEARMTFLRDYQPIKQASISLLKKYSTQKIVLQAHWDSLTVYKWTIYSMLYDRTPEHRIIEAIKEIEQYPYIQEAKTELSKADESFLFNDKDFMISNYSPKEYLAYCQKTLPVRKTKAVLKNKAKAIILKTISVFSK